MWDERYSNEEYAYGTEPNGFLVQALLENGGGRALCLAEGEGRNAVYLAQRGYDVLAIDQSPVGLQKAQALAASRYVTIRTRACDLRNFVFQPASWDLIVAIWAHVPPDLRMSMHQGVASALRAGGLYIIEAYHPSNIGRGTGGPQDPELCIRASDLRAELPALEPIHLEELEREVEEGVYHHGIAAVTQAVFRKRD